MTLILLVACVFSFLLGAITYSWLAWVEEKQKKHVCQLRTLFKRKAYMDRDGFWLQRCDDCQIETISRSKWLSDNCWTMVETVFRPKETPVTLYGFLGVINDA